MTAEFVEDYPLTTAKPKGRRDIGAATARSTEEGDETGETARAVGGNLPQSAAGSKVGDERTSGSVEDYQLPTIKPKGRRGIGAATAHSNDESDETRETARAVGGNLPLWTAKNKIGDGRPAKMTADSVEDNPLTTVKPRAWRDVDAETTHPGEIASAV